MWSVSTEFGVSHLWTVSQLFMDCSYLWTEGQLFMDLTYLKPYCNKAEGRVSKAGGRDSKAGGRLRDSSTREA